MIARLLMAAALTCAAAGCATFEDFAAHGGNLGRITSERLERFESEAAFRQYLRDAQRETRRRGGWWAGRVYPRAHAAMPFSEQDEEAIVVTGTRLVRQDFEAISPITTVGAEQLELTATLTTESLLNELPQSITNNQERGVDEGDIVKRIGRFLIILQDGRLFTVNLLPDGQPGLRFVDRENVYRSANESDWIDEMLVFGQRIVVTGYSYQLDATEVSVFAMSESGELTREAVYYISSNDYYDPENYATRIVGDNLIFYTPLGLTNIDPDQPFKWPLVRRWLRDDEREPVLSEGEPLFDARDIYRPMQETTSPVVYTISVCPLPAAVKGAELNCRSTAFVAPNDRVVYMSPEHIYVWTAEERWDTRRNRPDLCETQVADATPRQEATLYQISLRGAVRALRVRGMPSNQFSMAAVDREFRALLQDVCDETRLTYFHTPLGALDGDRPSFASSRRYVETPRLESDNNYEVRFTENYVVYGESTEWGDAPPDSAETILYGHIVAVPTRDPARATTIDVPHGVIRMERLGDDVVMTGYRDRRGLSVSHVDLSGAPRLANTLVLEGRFETEGRSHAFNATLNADGGGALGLPTAVYDGDMNRFPWESDDSDVTVLTFDASGRFNFAGTLARGDEVDPGYTCEVSCVDWYGNARPIFVAGRVLALTGADLVEGELRDGRIQERHRLDLTAQR